MTCVTVEIRTPAAQIFGSGLQVGRDVPEKRGVQVLSVAVLVGSSNRITIMAYTSVTARMYW